MRSTSAGGGGEGAGFDEEASVSGCDGSDVENQVNGGL